MKSIRFGAAVCGAVLAFAAHAEGVPGNKYQLRDKEEVKATAVKAVEGEREIEPGKRLSADGKTVWWDAKKFLKLEGQAWPDVKRPYDRLPASAATRIGKENAGVWNQCYHTSGECFRFTSTQRNFKIRWSLVSGQLALGHMPASGVSGLDLYVWKEDQGIWIPRSIGIPNKQDGNVMGAFCYPGVPMTLYLPLYNGVKSVEIGLDTNATVTAWTKPRRSGIQKPVVFYGTSITHGGVASRPGMSFPAIATRWLDVPLVNLGFSGSGKMEMAMCEYCAEIDASCYVLDCIWNMTPDMVRERFEPFVRELKKRRPDVPIVLADDAQVHIPGKVTGRGGLVKGIYDKLKAEDPVLWKNLYHVPNYLQFCADHEGTVDGSHPNDWGMMHLARGFATVIAEALDIKWDGAPKSWAPVEPQVNDGTESASMMLTVFLAAALTATPIDEILRVQADLLVARREAKGAPVKLNPTGSSVVDCEICKLADGSNVVWRGEGKGKVKVKGEGEGEQAKACLPVTRIEGTDFGVHDWWLGRLREKRREVAAFKNGEVDLVMLGDSITHLWDAHGGKALAELRKTYTVLNLGYKGDRTNHLLWRVKNGELDGYRAKVVQLMIGTNNAGWAPPADTAAAIREILAVIRAKQPQATVLLMPIFPRGPGRANGGRRINDEVNRLVRDCADGKRVIWFDVGSRFIGADGDVVRYMPDDRLHLNADGYRIWLDCLRRELSVLLRTPSADGGPVVTVSPDGEVKTPAAAVEKVRALRAQGLSADKTVTIELADGTYFLTEPLALDARDSHLVIRAKRRGKAILSGSQKLTWRPLADARAKALVPAAAQAHVVEAELPGTGPLPGFRGGGGASNKAKLSEHRLSLFEGEERLTCARWPKAGAFAHIGETWGTNMTPIAGVPVPHDGFFKFHDRTKLAKWAKEPDLWAFGYWHFEWAEVTHPVEFVRPEEETVKLDTRQDIFGYVKGAPFYVLNALSELDEPGEWAVDRAARKFFAWPKREAASLSVGRTDSIAVVSGATDVAFDGLVLESVRLTALTFANATNAAVRSCLVRHTGRWGVWIAGGRGARVEGCDLYDLGEGGIYLEGGDHDTLMPGDHVADNNHVHHYGVITPSSNPGVSLRGVACRATHNLVHHAGHQGMRFYGNDHYLGYNVIHDVCRYTWDAGAIYSYGVDWTNLGTLVEYNTIFMVGKQPRGGGVSGVYLDAYCSGVTVRGNIMNRIIDGVWHNGGQHNTFERNIFMNCSKSAIMRYDLGPGDAEMKSTWSKGRDSQLYRSVTSKLDLYRSDLWRKRYPWMLDALAFEDAQFAHHSLFCALSNNVSIASGPFTVFREKETGPYTVSTNNVFFADDPGFVDYAGLDWRVKPGSALAKVIPDDRFEKMGLYDSPLRFSPAVKFGDGVTPPRPLVGEFFSGGVEFWLEVKGGKRKSFQGNGADHLAWRDYSFTWTPDADGEATLTLRGRYGEKIAYDCLEMAGATLRDGGFEDGKAWRQVNALSNDPYLPNNRRPPYGIVGELPGNPKGFGPYAGGKMALLNGERWLVQEGIKVKKGEPVTLKMKARAYLPNY